MSDQDAPQMARAGRAQPGELMHLVADGLAGNGHRVSLPDFDEGRRLSIACPQARSTLTVEDSGSVVWDWRPEAGAVVDPGLLADLASALLTGQAVEDRREGDYERSDLTLKGRVGRELETRGLQVGLEIYPDEMAFEVHSAIVATARHIGLEAEVRVADDGWLCWEREYGVEAATVCWEPECATGIEDPGKVAGDIVAAVTLALSLGLPGQAGQR